MNFRTEIVQGEVQLSLLFSYMKHLNKVILSCHKLGIPVLSKIQMKMLFQAVILLAQMQKVHTVKFLNFRTPETFALNYLKLKQRGQRLG